mgnify:CR=1 FL=1
MLSPAPKTKIGVEIVCNLSCRGEIEGSREIFFMTLREKSLPKRTKVIRFFQNNAIILCIELKSVVYSF